MTDILEADQFLEAVQVASSGSLVAVLQDRLVAGEALRASQRGLLLVPEGPLPLVPECSSSRGYCSDVHMARNFSTPNHVQEPEAWGRDSCQAQEPEALECAS